MHFHKFIRRGSLLLALLLSLSLLFSACYAVPAAIQEEAGSPVSAAAEEPAAPEEAEEPQETEAAGEPAETPAPTEAPTPEPEPQIAEDGVYTSAEDVCAYLVAYGHLPGNFITKNEARALGWEGGSLERYAPGMCIGGDRFGNYEGSLPKASGRSYTECDIDTLGAKTRGAKRLVFSNDGLIFYTEDHYETFVLLYGEDVP